MPRYSIGVDLGGTNLRAAAIDEQGTLLERIAVPTNLEAGADAVVGNLTAAVSQLRNTCGREALSGVGVGVPGIIEMNKGLIRESPNLASFDGYPVRDEIENRLQTKVLLENDANAAALGEKWMGAGKDVDDLVLLTLGTGIGGGIIYRGEIMHGFVGMAGEFGHMQIVPNGNPCACGGQGCLEKHAAATAITLMARLLGLGDDLTSKQVFDLASAGNRDAQIVFETMGRALGVAIGALVNAFNFPLYLLSGGVLPAWEFFAPAMMQEISRTSYVFRNSNPTIGKAALGKDAGLFGAAFLPFRK